MAQKLYNELMIDGLAEPNYGAISTAGLPKTNNLCSSADKLSPQKTTPSPSKDLMNRKHLSSLALPTR